MIELTSTVNQVIRDYPETVSVFSAFGVDSCCGGARTIEDAAAGLGIESSILQEALELTVLPEEQLTAVSFSNDPRMIISTSCGCG